MLTISCEPYSQVNKYCVEMLIYFILQISVFLSRLRCELIKIITSDDDIDWIA